MHQLQRLLIFSVSFAACGALGAQAADSAQQALVARLYRQFSWEATGGDDGPGARTFIDQPRRVLLEYLEPTLVDLVLRDRACARRSREVCRLEFAPLWDSQDPDAVEITFRSVAGSARNAVVVHLRSSSGAATDVTVVTVHRPEGWRISDIEYARGGSLRRILGRKDGPAP
ncbi:MAG: hypothetical protein Q8K82_25060 [Gemmatimonadaceae bacterium]|nr:hypothetical protein [Gemmatimonadaceae bacterium]